MQIHVLQNYQQIEQLKKLPHVILYKHSAYCAVSTGIAYVLQQAQLPYLVYQVTVQTQRELSNEISNNLGIPHATPQAIIMKYGTIVSILNHNQCSEQALKLHI